MLSIHIGKIAFFETQLSKSITNYFIHVYY